MKIGKKYFKAGEFARLCGVKKDTLFHYDKIGLLKPEYKAKNGYRYYSLEQFYTFDTITVLKEAGTPLSEIREYLQQKDTRQFIEILKEKSLELSREQQRISRMKRMLDNTIRLSENALQVTSGTIEIKELPEEYFICTKAPDNPNFNMPDCLECIKDHIEYCRASGFGDELPMGEMILFDNVKKGNFIESFYCTKSTEKVDSPFLHVKEAGSYAVAYYQCSYEQLFKSYASFIQEIGLLGYAPAGNLYEEDLLTYLSESNPDEFLLKVSVKINPMKHDNPGFAAVHKG